MRDTNEPRATFVTGLFSVFAAFGHLGRLPRAWPYAIVPTLVFAALATLAVWGSFGWLEPVVRAALPASTSWYGRLGGGVVSIAGATLGALAGILVAFVSTP